MHPARPGQCFRARPPSRCLRDFPPFPGFPGSSGQKHRIMVYFFRARHFIPVSKRGCYIMPPLEAEYRKLYKQIERDRQPYLWKAHIQKNAYAYAEAICLIHLIVSIVDVVYMFCGTVYITNFFRCSYDKETLQDPLWKTMEKVVKTLNYGSHGFVPFPYIFTYTEYYLKLERSYCHEKMFMVPWTDLVNFICNCYWLKVCMMRYVAVKTKDLVTFEVIYLLDILKIILESPDPERFRHDPDTYGQYEFMKYPHTGVLIALVYIEYLFIRKLKGESEEMRAKCIGVRLLHRIRGPLSEEEKDFEETMKYIPMHLIHEILDV